MKLNIYRTLRDFLQDAAAQLSLLLLHLDNSRVEARVLDLEARVLDLEARVLDLEVRVLDLEAKVLDLQYRVPSQQLLILGVEGITKQVEDLEESFLPKIKPNLTKFQLMLNPSYLAIFSREDPFRSLDLRSTLGHWMRILARATFFTLMAFMRGESPSTSLMLGSTRGHSRRIFRMSGLPTLMASMQKQLQQKKNTEEEKVEENSSTSSKKQKVEENSKEQKEDIVGAAAIKPPGWDRKGWESVKFFLYDPEHAGSCRGWFPARAGNHPRQDPSLLAA